MLRHSVTDGEVAATGVCFVIKGPNQKLKCAPACVEFWLVPLRFSAPVGWEILVSVGVLGHGSSHDTDLSDNPPKGLTWEQWHMKQEHGLDEYSSGVFFQLHDSKNKGYLDGNDILNIYGLFRDEVVGKGDGLGAHDDSEVIGEDTKKKIIKQVMDLVDPNNDGRISRDEYTAFAEKGGEFPDLNVGVGHHGDFEHEYEVHHWNKYHKDSDPDIKVVHKEDIEHELLHHEHEIEHEQPEGQRLSDESF
ncbi:nucleobindin SSP120 CYBJADRAFT_161430 [Cyberlindnera jadinii NRRL Y-1542]|uniref:EF-hand domain-containing protein n=1 Tax=Cyberlindnera jadinii (strain ATCC 18201 / CBS 1600 / BCRC 20928 / JCM 3617 / NBRC 0987 / NRRL Y-1542) TaxID=983966 RepID=A0A1E4S5Z3_CYBJN|nr:hypothetical protein CYBJADRAFT_161430 [Cyberlindnera jadinii NRRL Y-1542]ODV74946.1 hypothetical protein CYBJADRAFT_161430 [Cyberlindnera jadinii NRRL Y-1542]